MAQIRVITLRITPHEHEAIREAAHRERISINAWLTQLVRNNLDIPSIVGPVYKCPKCAATFEEVAIYERHFLSEHASVDQQEPSDVSNVQQESDVGATV